MSLNQKKRQQKRAKKAAKRKTVVAAKKVAEGRTKLLTRARSIALAVRSPIHECLVSELIDEEGMGTVIISRALPDGRIGAGLFLVDAYCLGIKNAGLLVLFQDEYNDWVTRTLQNETLIAVDPSYARKLIESAVAYAKDLGFNPHPDYQLAKRILGDIDAAACSTEFTFGKDGMPLFITGPTDTPKRIEKILQTLTERCGPGGFHYLVGIGDDDFEQIGDQFEDAHIMYEDDEYNDDDEAIEVEFEREG